MGGVGAAQSGGLFERFPGAARGALPPRYERRQPELSVLHQVVRTHLAAFLERASEDGRGIPAHARREVERYLGCGILSEGFTRVRCPECRTERLVAHSCKGRGLCPSCGARRMNETAAELVDHVLPRAPYRQWVLTVPYRVRYLLARKPELVTVVLACFLRLVTAHLRRAARIRSGAGQAASVTWVQRFGDSLNLHPHFHAVVADGVFIPCADGAVVFQAVPPPTDEEVAALCAKVARRVTRLLKRRGYLEETESDEPPTVMDQLQARSVRTTMAYRDPNGEDPSPRHRCASIDGFSVHANVHLHANDRPGLEHLCRYAGRNSLALSRLEQNAQGQVIYRFKKPMANGATQAVMTPMDFMGRLIALVPPPRAHLTRYHGCLAPNAKLRPKVVLVPKPKPDPSAKPAAPCPPRRLSWADLLKRVFAIDVLQCPKCPGRMQILAHVTERAVVKKILAHLGLPTAPPSRGVTEPIIASVDEPSDWVDVSDYSIDPPYDEEDAPSPALPEAEKAGLNFRSLPRENHSSS